ncbi:alkaline shock response membrane anchor protein AmaP [Atopobium fossor]|uniref:alkaline shock response membrane anchor protein AmaP n=1 Tax=Atopobium fossor TaxID=39487 RepID=UPI000401B94D|nr:alkaline shock response membrane anchor protein AmaP [Atopobium fossor]
MSGFKRFCLFIYSLSGLLLFAVDALTFASPWADQLSTLLLIPEYTYVLGTLAAFTVLGLLATFITSLVGHAKTAVVVAQTDTGDITVSRDAIASQAAYIVAAAGDARARDVYVTINRNNKVDVFIKVIPFASMNVVTRGPELMEQLTSNLALLCGEHLGSVHISYMDAKEPAVLVKNDEDSAEDFDEQADGTQEESCGSQYDEITYIPSSSNNSTPSNSTTKAEEDN